MIEIVPDPSEISKEAHEDVKARKKNQQLRLLTAYYRYGPLISARAEQLAGLEDSEHWVRTGELRKQGLLNWVVGNDGEIVKVMGPKGSKCGVQEISYKGRLYVRENNR